LVKPSITTAARSGAPLANKHRDGRADTSRAPKQAEKEMEDYRNHRATTLLEEALAFRKQNSADPWTYQNRLKEIAASYAQRPSRGSSQASGRTEKSATSPDRLETAAPNRRTISSYTTSIFRSRDSMARTTVRR